MIHKQKSRLAMILLSTLLMTLSLAACSPKFSSTAVQQPASDGRTMPDADESEEIIVTPVEDTDIKDIPTDEGSMEGEDHWALPELAELKQATACYFDPDSAYYMGEEATAIFKEYLYASKFLREPIPAMHWETLMRSLFLFHGGQEDDAMISMYIQGLMEDGKLTREIAVSGLLKLLSLRYRIPLGGDSEAWKASDSITDMVDCSDMHEPLARIAYVEGLTDKSVEDTLLIRPQELLSYGEALSMASRAIRKYGLPPMEGSSEKVLPDDVALNATDWMIIECEDYYQRISASDNALDRIKIDMLQEAESILSPGRTADTLNAPVALETWQAVLTDALDLSPEEVKAYTELGQSGFLTYDVAAISLFKMGFKIGAFEIRDATPEEKEEARRLVPTLDQALDTSKFAQMVSSGLLRGISQMEGFSPSAPVSAGEAMLLVKRTVEKIP